MDQDRGSTPAAQVPTIAGLTLGSAAVLLALPALDAQPLAAAVFVILWASPATPS